MASCELMPPSERETIDRDAGNVLRWLPLLWSRVLFPGPAAEVESWRWRPLLALAVLSGLLLYPRLGFHLFEPDEGRYAQIPREMLERGDWIVPTLQGEPYLDKPPLFYWLVMGCYALFGYHAWAARLVPAIAMQATVLLSYALGRRLVGDRPAWWGAALLTVAPAFFGMGRLLLLDGLLTFCITASALAIYLAQRGARLHWGWWLAAATACGLGVLTKGPIALILTLMPLVLHRLLAHGSAPLGRRAWLAFGGVVLALTLPWYVVACCRLPELARHFLWEHNVMRFVQPFDHERPVWFYLPIMIGGLLPLTLLSPWLLRFLLSGHRDDAQQRSAEFGYLLLSGGWCVFFFSMSGCKLPTYVLPAFAPLCLAAGRCAVAAVRPGPLLATIGGHWLLLAVGFLFVLPWYAEMRSPVQDGEGIQALCSDPSVPVICFPRNVDSVAFHVGRSDFRSFRSKQLGEFLDFLDRHPRVVVLFAHRSSLELLRQRLPSHLRLVATGPLGLCDHAVVERIAGTIP